MYIVEYWRSEYRAWVKLYSYAEKKEAERRADFVMKTYMISVRVRMDTIKCDWKKVGF